MKFGIIGDLHLTHKTPARRNDDIFETQMLKLSNAFKFFKDEKVDAVIQVGDFFDTPRVCMSVVARILHFLQEHKLKVYCVFGQHDVYGHSKETFYRSPLNILEVAGAVHMLDVDGHLLNGCSVFGSSYGLEIPEPDDSRFSILVTHRMIGNEELFPGQVLEKPNSFLRKYPFDLVICGDYHYPFDSVYKNRMIVNCGCLIRKTCSVRDMDLEPQVAVFDTADRDYKIHKLPIQPSEDIFDFSRIDVKDSKLDISMDFIDKLKNNSIESLQWKSILKEAINHKDVSSGVREKINTILQELTINV